LTRHRTKSRNTFPYGTVSFACRPVPYRGGSLFQSLFLARKLSGAESRAEPSGWQGAHR